ncbi:efflux RND transporter periplasmic adaptor subunit [Candidatus Falkowbacteria bacterium]|jgi:RND family efflux transporter MFP subunit|nr:efflux RND transporter periplasmic adaptor subunit [Candidatus Falkowbacteria bacterium]MBT5502976.1 efflux RND transporter periplasmic adaptor subunit [Candidatus Falkowbacteria bacterium]MBT6574332.1 efflux RND transporter periplasmic adaptor subunit [Candidatus Falkowbacteria bacterium]MBT7349075.1 efflux RND transporter periplasmic adaptor subunit [Candidatus Falkowbacteria bacterium]MBT7500931.1 efflux RND transporter periplasmic adaptor subunit [Candidatus Falkowbacteria bacterium]
MFYKKKSFWIITVIVIIIVGFFIYQAKKPVLPEFDTLEIQAGELIQEISITGSVQAAEEVDLALEKSGKVTYLPVKVGDQVFKGKVLLRLNNADLAAQRNQASAQVDQAKAQLLQYQAALATQQSTLEEYKLGTRPETLQIKQTAVNNALVALTDAQSNLTNVQNKATTDLAEDYEAALNALSTSITTAENTIYTITDIQATYFNDNDQDSSKFSTAKGNMIYPIWGATNAGRWTKSNLSGLTGGAKGILLSTQADPTHSNIDNALQTVKNAIQTVKTELNNIPIVLEMSSANITIINTEKTDIDSEITALTTKEQAIILQKATSESNIIAAQTTVNTKQSVITTAQNELTLSQAGYTSEQIAAQQAKVDQAQANVDSQLASIKSAQANVANYQAQIGKTYITSPIQGIVTKIDAKLGEIVAANSQVITVISEAKYQIEANVPEVDIANIKIDDIGIVTLDAYSSDKEFQATVIKIDPAETIIDNVPTYKVTFQFDEESDLIKSGMTADLDILTEKKENVISVPQRAILKQNGDKIVRILNEDGLDFTEVKVRTGLRGSNGNVEILEGINEGDEIVISIKNGK